MSVTNSTRIWTLHAAATFHADTRAATGTFKLIDYQMFYAIWYWSKRLSKMSDKWIHFHSSIIHVEILFSYLSPNINLSNPFTGSVIFTPIKVWLRFMPALNISVGIGNFANGNMFKIVLQWGNICPCCKGCVWWHFQ